MKSKIFKASDLFSVDRGTRLIATKRIKGKIPLATAGFFNQGIADFISNKENKTFKLSFTIDMFGNVFPRNYSYKADDNIHIINNDFVNEDNVIYLSTSVTKSIENIYSYGKQFRLKSFEKLNLLLPTTPDGSPDYEYMESYSKALFKRKEQEYLSYIEKRLDELKNVTQPVPLQEKEWDTFFIEEKFQIKSGKRLVKSDMKQGNIPFIGASDSNNGITMFIDNNNTSKDKNVLGVNYDGSVVENFYHPYTALFSDSVKRVSFTEIEGNKYQYLFLKTLILQQKSKYEYGYKFNGERMKRQKILLPINSSGTPDYEYMELYMKYQELTKLKEYLTFKKQL